MPRALTATQATPTYSDHELVAAVRDGSDRAFEELYARYRGRIGSYILGLVGDHARAEDIAQEVFISALRRLRQTEQPVAFKPWIYEIAKNACTDEFRRTRRVREVPLEPEDEGPHTNQRLCSQAPTPEAAIEHKQSLRDLQGAFHGLSENHHRLIVMREFEGLSSSEIGERLGMSRPVVESSLFRARKRLSHEYHELASGRRCEQVQALIAADEPQSLLKLGLRRRRQLARHLAHCQSCRYQARLAGVDDSLFQAPSVPGKIAALLPWLRWRRGGTRGEGSPGSDTHASPLLGSVQGAARFADLVAPSTGLGRAVAAAAAVAVAGFGGGAVIGGAGHGHSAATMRGSSSLSSYRGGSAGAASKGARLGWIGGRRQYGESRRRVAVRFGSLAIRLERGRWDGGQTRDDGAARDAARQRGCPGAVRLRPRWRLGVLAVRRDDSCLQGPRAGGVWRRLGGDGPRSGPAEGRHAEIARRQHAVLAGQGSAAAGAEGRGPEREHADGDHADREHADREHADREHADRVGSEGAVGESAERRDRAILGRSGRGAAW